MAETQPQKTVRIVDANGSTAMEMLSMGRDGDRLFVEGRLMGAWPAKMYVSQQDIKTMIAMAFSNRAVMGYIVSFPFLLLKRQKK